jgi:hypothetical protein
MQKENNVIKTVPLLWPDSQDGALASDIISLKKHPQADIYIMIGATIGKAGAVTLHKGTSVSSAATALAFSRYLSTGFVLDYDGESVDTPAAAGETVTGAGGGIGYVYRDLGNRLICYAFNGTTFVDNEVLTFSGGKTAVANGIQKNEDIMVPRTATSNTFDIAAVGNKMYCIPINAADLGDGYDCLELNVADLDTTELAAWVVLSDARYMAEVPETAIYD